MPNSYIRCISFVYGGDTLCDCESSLDYLESYINSVSRVLLYSQITVPIVCTIPCVALPLILFSSLVSGIRELIRSLFKC